MDGWLKNGKLYLAGSGLQNGERLFDLADVRYGLGIQMLLYLFALQRNGGGYFGRPRGTGGSAVSAGQRCG